MKVISGEKRGTKLFSFSGRNIRPTSQRVKEAIFNILKSRNYDFKEKIIYDLFAGTGSLGLETLSRGSKKVYFFDNDRQSIKILGKNVNKLKYSDYCEIIETDLENYNFLSPKKPNLIFCDPPYNSNFICFILEFLLEKKIIEKNCLIIIETSKKNIFNFKNKFEILEDRTYGKTKVYFLKKIIN